MAQPESKLSRQIMTALRARGIWCMKIHGGPFTMAGAPDIIACVPACVCGRIFPPCNHRNLPVMGHFVGFETKTATGRDPTPIQERVHDNIRASAGHVFVVRSVQDAVDALNRLPVFRRADPRR